MIVFLKFYVLPGSFFPEPLTRERSFSLLLSFVVVVFSFHALVFLGCHLPYLQALDMGSKEILLDNSQPYYFLATEIHNTSEFSPPFRTFLCLFNITFLGFLVVLSGKNWEKYVYIIFPEAEDSGRHLNMPVSGRHT